MKLHGLLTTLVNLEKSHIPKCWNWINDAKVIRHMSGPFVTTYRGELKWFREMQNNKNNRVFAILDKETGTHIGNLGLEDISRYHKKATYGLIIGEKKYWNKGYGTDATRIALRYAFKRLKLNKVSLTVFPENKGGIKVYQRAGFKKVGRLKKDVKVRGKFQDTIFMEVMAEDFLTNKS